MTSGVQKTIQVAFLQVGWPRWSALATSSPWQCSLWWEMRGCLKNTGRQPWWWPPPLPLINSCKCAKAAASSLLLNRSHASQWQPRHLVGFLSYPCLCRCVPCLVQKVRWILDLFVLISSCYVWPMTPSFWNADLITQGLGCFRSVTLPLCIRFHRMHKAWQGCLCAVRISAVLPIFLLCFCFEKLSLLPLWLQ